MNFSIAIGQDQSVSLINNQGETLWLFPNLDAARGACRDWYATPEQNSSTATAPEADDTQIH